MRTLERRLYLRSVIRPSGCVEWTGHVAKVGYGQMKVDGKKVYVHRLAYALAEGPVPVGLYVCHSCDNRVCVNAQHLWLGTHLENVADMHSKGRGSRAGTPPERARSAKLCWDQVREVRRLHRAGADRAALAERFGCTRTNINYIVTGKTWKEK